MAARHRIARLLAAWYARGHRDLPWRRTRDPYAIWISEIMLQQTRAVAAIPYYEKFLARFPTVEALASAAEDDVLAEWAGLGYYSRARNVWRAARQMALAGGFPTGYAAIRELPGVGDYTAAAVGSIAFGLPYAAIDGNVLRVVARVENDASDIASAKTRERFRAIAQEWLAGSPAGPFNEAMMELGATVCVPRRPQCPVCPLAAVCQARQAGRAEELPVKLRRMDTVELARTLLVIRRGGKILLRRHADDARHLAGFWDLPSPEDVPSARLGAAAGEFRHTITRHRFTIQVREATLRGAVPGCQWFELGQFVEIPLSTTARKAVTLCGIVPKL